MILIILLITILAYILGYVTGSSNEKYKHLLKNYGKRKKTN